jgi:hypothetical protein
MNLLPVILLGVAACLPAVSSAQWRWVDKSGHTVFSDQPPPPDIPASSVRSQPRGKGRAESAAAAASGANDAAAAPVPKLAASAAKSNPKDKELQEKKRQAEAAEAEKRKAEEADAERLRAENCTRAKRAKATVDSGGRIAVTNAKGEREIMDDAARAAEAKRLEGIIAKDCKPAAG